MLRSRAEKRLVLSGFSSAVLRGQGVTTFSLKNAFLLRNKIEVIIRERITTYLGFSCVGKSYVGLSNIGKTYVGKSNAIK